MADLVKEDKHFRVSYKFPKQQIVNMSYTAPSMASLMKNLQLSENVNRDTVEFLYVHQILPGGKTLELVAVDQHTKTNVTSIYSVKKDTVITGEYDDDDALLGYPTSGRDEAILKEVTSLLTTKPHVILKAAPIKTRGFTFTAVAARSLLSGD